MENNSLKKIYSLMERMDNLGNGLLLTESQESKSQQEAIRYVENKLGYSHEKANEFVRVTLRNEITALRDKKLGKFTLGVTRMYCDGQIRNANTISNLNSTLKLLSAHLNEYDRNLNGLSAQELIDRFAQTRQNNLDAERADIDAMDFSASTDYKIVPINSFEEAQEYYRYTYEESPWCLTHMRDMFDAYTCDGINQIYFCLKNGFESIEPVVGANAPFDEYGLSMISVIVNENGELACCTTRWNHENGGTDSAMSTKEISEVIGVHFFKTFKPNNKWNDAISNAKERLANGEPLKDIFRNIYRSSHDFYKVELCNKWNFINPNREILCNQWFDWAEDFIDGFARVDLNRKQNFININGDFISNEWFDGAENFDEGIAEVWDDQKGVNLINTNGQRISTQWFDFVSYKFSDGLVKVRKNKKFNFINIYNPMSEPISEIWFNNADNFHNGFAKVWLHDKGCNYIDINGDVINPDNWFTDNNSKVINGYQYVYVYGKDGFNFINANNKKIVSPNQCFDDVIQQFVDGFAIVIIDEVKYKLDTEGNLYNLHNLNESMNIKRKIIITESQEQQLLEHLILEQTFPVDTNKVLLVKNYLDKNFKKGNLDEFGENGLPVKTPVVGMLTNGEVVKNLTAKQLYELLLHEFRGMFGNKIQLSKFLVQVIKDWYSNKISKEGLLSKNNY